MEVACDTGIQGGICGRFRWASTWASAGHPGGIRGPFWGIHIKSVSGLLGVPTLLALQNVPEFPFYKIKKCEKASFSVFVVCTGSAVRQWLGGGGGI